MGKLNKSRVLKHSVKQNDHEMEVDLKKPKKLNTTLFKAKQIIEKKQKIPAPKILKEATKEIKETGKLTVKKKEEKKGQSEKHQTKKEKQQEKHKNLLKKFQDQKKKDKDEKKRKNREKTAVIGDMKPMKDALPSLDDLFSMDRSQMKTGIKEVDLMTKKKLTKVEKIKKRKNEVISRVDCIQSWLKDSDYKKNPREAIAAHIKYMKSLED
ncbi:hypothetical protein ACFFRR_011272 [Megaselia abdita]